MEQKNENVVVTSFSNSRKESFQETKDWDLKKQGFDNSTFHVRNKDLSKKYFILIKNGIFYYILITLTFF